jgi:flagellin-like protein
MKIDYNILRLQTEPEPMGRRWTDNRGATPIIGNILLVAIVIVLAVALTTFAFAFLESTGTPSADVAFEYEQTPVGLKMTPVAIGTDVVVKLNGRQIAEIGADQAGRSVLLPTAPGDRITVISQDEQRSVLVERETDEREELGDFISYYTFEEGDDSTVLVDQSGNGNDGDLKDDGGGSGPQWGGCGLQFDGSNDHVQIDDIEADVDVEAFTIAVAYEQTGSTGRVNQLVEHRFSGGEEWFLETSHASGESYTNEYSIDFAVEYDDHVASSGEVQPNTRHVVVGTYDGSSYVLYVDGERVDSGTHSETVEMGTLRLGRDFESTSQYLDGEICEMRLYYSAFDSDDVERITNAMED